ncbi:MAG: choice-of-anchor J domain-containing protein [Bacteroidota bacterium]
MRNPLGRRAVLTLVLLLTLGSLKGQILFSEDFQGGVLPTGWTTFDGDLQTPNANVSYFTDPWIVRADFDIMGDTAAMSTSWYFPLQGPSDDWLISPAITLNGNAELRWEGESQDVFFPESYEVLASTAASPLPVSNFSATLTQVTGESGGVRTLRSVPLTSVTGNVYFAWRNISFDQFILVIDNIEVRNLLSEDVALTDGNRPEFTILPESQATAIPVEGEISNVGSNAATNVSLTVNVYNGGFTQVYTSTANPQSIPSGNAANFALPDFMPPNPDLYTFEFIADFTGDLDRSNDTLYWSILVSDSVMARDNGVVNGTLGIGAGNGGTLGQTFYLNSPDFISSVDCYMEVTAGESYFAEIYNFNGRPNSVVARTDTFIATVDTALTLNFPIIGGAYQLPADTFFVGLAEPDSALAVGYSFDIYTPGTTWLDWPTNPFNTWANNEDFGFDASYILRANIEKPCPDYVLAPTVQNASCNANDGVANVAVTGGPGPFSYQWSANAGGQTTPTAFNLSAGQYTVVVTDTLGCSDSVQVIVNNLGGPSITNILVNSILCNGDSTGSAIVNPSGGTPPYSYVWSNSDTTQSIQNLPAGQYTVTVVDANQCQAIQSATLNQPAAILPNVVTSSATCATCSDGTASATPSGGMPPYTYNWSGGSNNSAVTNLAPGNHAVTVTDANGCTGQQIFSVGFVVGIDPVVSLQVEVFPNPSDGHFRLRIASGQPEEISIEIYNQRGQLAWRHRIVGQNEFVRTFDPFELAAGSYLIRVAAGDQETVRRLQIQ